MRVAAVFDAFHEANDRSDPYVFAQYCSCITAMPSLNKGVEVAKRSVLVTDKGITIGAVNYPYNASNKELAFREVKAVKSANMTFRCVHDTATGKFVPVKYDKKAGMYVSPSGALYKERDIEHKYYNSNTLNQEEARLNAGQPLQTCMEYVDWMRRHKLSTKVLDIGIPAGRDMASVVDDVYFGSFTPTRNIVVPEFYLRTRQVVNFRVNAVEDFILKVARSDIQGFSYEYPRGKGVVTRVESDGKYTYIDYTKVANIPDPSDPTKKIWVTTDSVDTIKIPDHKGNCEVLVDCWDYTTNQVVDPNHILNNFTRLARTIPYNPSYTSYNAIVEAVGEVAIKEISQHVIEQHSPTIRGVSSIALSFLGDMPKGVTENDFFARNKRTVMLFECEPGALIQQLNNHVSINLLHHYWYKPYNKAANKHEETTILEPAATVVA